MAQEDHAKVKHEGLKVPLIGIPPDAPDAPDAATPGETRSLRIRSVHIGAPQPGQVATVIGITEHRRNGQWLECYVARFDNGELWFCPLMATKDYERVPPGEANDSRTASDEAVVCKELLDCPWCNGTPNLSELRYTNTGRLYGYKLSCACCNFEKKISPAGWMMGQESEAMENARTSLIRWWNNRVQPNAAQRESALPSATLFGVVVQAGTDSETGKLRIIIETTEAQLRDMRSNIMFQPCRVEMLERYPVLPTPNDPSSATAAGDDAERKGDS